MKDQNTNLLEEELLKYYILNNIWEIYLRRSITISEILKEYYEWRRQNGLNLLLTEDKLKEDKRLLTISYIQKYCTFPYLYYGREIEQLRLSFEECVLEKISEYSIDNIVYHDILYTTYLSTIQSERAWMNPIYYYNKNNDWKHIVFDMMSDKARKKYNMGKYTHDIISD